MPPMHSEALHHTTISLDVQGSSSRTNPQKLAMRRTLYAAVEAAARFADLNYAIWHLEDRGDGLLATVPARVPKSRILGPWVEGLYRALRAGGRPPSEAAPVQLRAGIHAGEVHRDRYGVVGADVDLACRLADADIAKRVLGTTPAAHLAVVVSDTVYQSVVHHGGPHLDPERYRQVAVTVKELSTLAWLYLPGYAVPPLPGEPDPGRPAGPAPVWDPDRTDPRLRMIGSVFGPGSVFDATSMHHRQIDQLYRDADPEER